MSVGERWSAVERTALRSILGAPSTAADRKHDAERTHRVLLQAVRRLIPADEAAAVILDSRRQSVQSIVGTPHAIPLRGRIVRRESFWNDCWAGPGPPEARARHAPARLNHVTVHDLFGAPTTDAAALFAALRITDRTEVRVLLLRSAREFSDTDEMLLGLLLPHLRRHFHATLDHQDDPLLTPRQHSVVLLAARGRSNKEIATQLQVSVGTVRKHLDNAFERLGVSNRSAAAACAFPHGLPAVEGPY